MLIRASDMTGPIREFAIAVGAYSKGGGLLTMCSSREGARGGLFRGGGVIRGSAVVNFKISRKL